MSHQSSKNLDLADSLIVSNPKLNIRLNKIDQLVDWAAFEEILNPIYAAKAGRPSYPILTLFKCLLLQTWYSLSDYALEEALDDRISFRKFVRLSFSQKIPDHSTFSRFRDQLVRLNLKDALFLELDRQLQKLNLIVKKGTLVDATVIEASVSKPNKNSDNSSGTSSKDPDANWTKKRGQFHYGYKAHIGVDQESELIRKLELTPANVHDGEMLKKVITNEEEWVYADKAYDSYKNSLILDEKGIKNGIMMKGSRNNPIGNSEKYCNKILSKYRSAVERIFGTLKRSYEYRRSRYIA